MGVGGTGMNALARLLVGRGCVVTGSDRAESPVTRELARLGVRVVIGHSPSHVPERIDIEVISAAVRDDNPEVIEAVRREVAVIKYAQAVGLLMREMQGIAVAGTHGKTTTTAMVATILHTAGLNPTMLVGGNVPQLGGSYLIGSGPHFVVEACEYDRSFLNLSPYAAVITNIDADHLDYYGNVGAVEKAFGKLAELVHPDGVLVYNADDPRAERAASGARCARVGFGLRTDGRKRNGRGGSWKLLNWHRSAGRTLFEVARSGRSLGKFSLQPPGLHNVFNAVAALAVCDFLGVSIETAREGVAGYAGAERRCELLGEVFGASVFDDYAHHPTEITATLAALRDEYPAQKLWCVFQPHQCSRTRLLMDQFVGAFGDADVVIVPEIYSVRDTDEDRRAVCSADLVRRLRAVGVEAYHAPEFADAVNRLAAEVGPGEVVVTMGAGPVYEVAHTLIARAGESKE